MLIPSSLPIKTIPIFQHSTHIPCPSCSFPPLKAELPQPEVTIPFGASHCILFLLLSGHLSRSALYWAPVTLSPSLLRCQGLCFIYFSLLWQNHNASWHIEGPYKWWVGFFQILLSFWAHCTAVSQRSYKVTVGNEGKGEEESVCILVWQRGSEVPLWGICGVQCAWISKSVFTSGWEASETDFATEMSEVNFTLQHLLQEVLQHSSLCADKSDPWFRGGLEQVTERHVRGILTGEGVLWQNKNFVLMRIMPS